MRPRASGRRLALTSLFLLAVAGSAAGQSETLYVSSLLNHEVLRYDGQTGMFIDTWITAGRGGLTRPHAILQRRSDVLVASFGSDEVLRFDRADGAFLGVFAGPEEGVHDPVYLIDGPDGYLYLSSQASDDVLRLCPLGGAVEVFIEAGLGGLDGPSGVAFGPDGRFYVAGRYSANVIAYEAETGAFLEVIADSDNGLGVGTTFGLNFGDNGDLYFASNDQVFRFDLDSGAIVATIPIAFPIGIEPGPPGYVRVASSNNLFLIDTDDNRVSGPFLSGGNINVLNFFHEPSRPPRATLDGNCDGRVDLADHAAFSACTAGPAALPDPSPPWTTDDCLLIFDTDHDEDVDLRDWAELQLRLLE